MAMDGLMIPLIAIISEQSQLRQNKKMTGLLIRHCQWDLRQRLMTQGRMAASRRERTVAKSGRIYPHHQDIGGQN